MSNIQRLNYSVKWMEDVARIPAAHPHSRSLAEISSIISRAQHFILPDCGNLLPRKGRRPHDIDLLSVRPPFDDIVIEYSAVNGRSVTEDETSSTRRIVVASMGEIEGIPSVRIFPIWYVDITREWIAPGVMWCIPLEGPMISYGGMRYSEQVTFYPIEHRTGAISEYAALMGGSIQEAVADMARNSEDELQAYLDLCYALSCSNIEMQTIAPPSALNMNRVKSGKRRLFDYKVLVLAPRSQGEERVSAATDRAAPRAHLRRGHVRHLPSGRRVWVNATMVRGSGEGFVHKDYFVSPQLAQSNTLGQTA